jgi:LysR family transcriptional regulator, cys regulon transcriptional activator
LKLQQLRYVVEIVRNGNRLSAAADALNTSQPGVSRQIQQLEAELGFDIFVRTRNKIIGLTSPGEQLFAIAKRVMTDVEAVKSLREEVTSGNRGTLIVGTTHLQARYLLPPVIERFSKAYPGVALMLKQGNPTYACELVDAGEADLAIGTETTRNFPRLVQLPFAKLSRSVFAKAGHPILSVKRLTLKEIAQYPIITYDQNYSGRWKVMKAFKDANLDPQIVLSAIDADICKTYVEMGLGIAILSTMASDPQRDVALGVRDASDLFEPSVISVSLRVNTYLRPFLLDFIKTVAPSLTRSVVREAIDQAEAAVIDPFE